MCSGDASTADGMDGVRRCVVVVQRWWVEWVE